MTTFLSETNVKLMWDIILEQDSYIHLNPEEKLKINTIFKTHIKPYYQEQINKGIHTLQELDKQYIRFIIDKINESAITLDIREYPIIQENTTNIEPIKQEEMNKLLNEMVLQRNYDIKPIKVPNLPTQLNTENSFIPIIEDIEDNTFLKKLKKIDKPSYVKPTELELKIQTLENEINELKRLFYEMKDKYAS